MTGHEWSPDAMIASNRQLASWERQWYAAETPIRCYHGHEMCGCSNVASMDGSAPCHEEVAAEIRRRKFSAWLEKLGRREQRLTERIGALMSERVIVEEAIADTIRRFRGGPAAAP